MSQPHMEQAHREIRGQLVSAFESGQAHMALAEATRAFPRSAINERLPRVPYSFWHLVEHIRLAQRDMLDYMVSTSYAEPPFPEGYWPGPRARATVPSGDSLSRGSTRIGTRSSSSSGTRAAISSRRCPTVAAGTRSFGVVS